MKFIKKLLKSEGGSIVSMVIAVLVSMVSIISSASLMNLVNADHIDTQYAHDKLQEEFLLRSEMRRTHLAIEHNDIAPLPPRIVEIIEPQRSTTYYITNSKQNISITFFMGFTTEQAIAIQSLVTAKRARKLTRSYKSPVKRYSERVIKNKSLAEYQYFTHTEESENADGGTLAARVKFWGGDELFGPVHSNTDIWIQQRDPAGGGVGNEGWPIFWDMVTTAGIFRKHPNGEHLPDVANMDQIFRYEPPPGWMENVPSIIFEPTAELIKANGTYLGEPSTDIVYVKLGGGSFTCMLGEIVETRVDTFGVYSWFPHNATVANNIINAGGNWYEDSDHIGTNYVTIYDTMWTVESGFPVDDESVWIEHGQLWIEGEVYGAQTWGCADTIFIVDDITYANTSPGHPPDNPQNPNTSDYFGLVSEQKILIRYKHRDPFENMELIDHNCDGIMLYGAYAAIAQGNESIHGVMACHYDGIFTFQYHHPHGSTPDFWAHSPFISAEFTIYLLDSGGDGWDDATLDVIVEGVTVLDDITCSGSQSIYQFTVDNGDIVETQYIQGGNENEHSYEIYDQNDNLIASDGPPPGPGIMFQVFLPAEQDTLYTFIDLHKFIFPINLSVPANILGFNLHGAAPPPGYPCCGFPYESPGYSFPNNNSSNYVFPYGTDYPWYNPVWPESIEDIFFERGTITIYGAIAQTRRGFVHRSGGDPYNHPQGGVSPSPWEMDEYHYDGFHPSTGYGKDYHFDNRFRYIQPPDYPQIYEGWGENQLTAFTKQSWSFKSPPTD